MNYYCKLQRIASESSVF